MTRQLVGFFEGKPIYTTAPEPAPAKGEPEPVRVVKQTDVEIGEKGTVSARICTFDTLDLQSDVVMRGAFGKTPQEVVVSAWNHSAYDSGHDALPVGVGLVRAEGDHGVFRGRLLLETTAGKDTYEVLKAMGGRCQWSWGFTVTEEHRGSFRGKPARFLDSVVVSEVSPVILAASIGTGTVELHGQDDQQLELQRRARELQRAPADEARRARRALAVEVERARALGVRV